MSFIANILVGLVAALQLGFLVLEIFFWGHPFGRRTFKMTADYSKASATLAANQGLYNGFLAAGLIWGLIAASDSIKVFFLVCVLAAGIFGGRTAKCSILFLQALPALLALIALYLSQ